MPRRKPLTTAESDERLAYVVACGHWSNLACCRHADRPFRSRQAAADYIANKLADAAFCSRVERYQEMLARDDANLRHDRDVVGGLRRRVDCESALIGFDRLPPAASSRSPARRDPQQQGFPERGWWRRLFARAAP